MLLEPHQKSQTQKLQWGLGSSTSISLKQYSHGDVCFCFSRQLCESRGARLKCEMLSPVVIICRTSVFPPATLWHWPLMSLLALNRIWLMCFVAFQWYEPHWVDLHKHAPRNHKNTHNPSAGLRIARLALANVRMPLHHCKPLYARTWFLDSINHLSVRIGLQVHTNQNKPLNLTLNL